MGCHNTYENYPDSRFKTHYYRESYNEVKFQILEIAKGMQMSISNVNDEYQEIFLVSSKYNLMVKITSYAPGETSVDLYLESRKTFDFWGWKNFIILWHKMLADRLTFVGIALHP